MLSWLQLLSWPYDPNLLLVIEADISVPPGTIESLEEWAVLRPGTNGRLQGVSSRFGTPAVREWWSRMPPELHCCTVQPRSLSGLSHCF